ncbi:MAG TPA: amino acid adenylation domain-containing protein, partial [Thermoanaerobaculia bacterium]|nr:amino acid adenylation domain-containing protein [Thermoanaerobaculia bacterium]
MAEVIARPVPPSGPFDAGQPFAAGRNAGPPAAAGSELSAVEHHLLFHEWCDTARDVPLRPLIHELVAERARVAPAALAVVDGDRRIDYGELDARANGLARRLQALGVGPETRVALLSERSIELVLGELAVLKAGGGYVPIDPRFPRERRDYMLEDSRAAVVLVHPDQESQLAASPVPVVRLRADEPPCAAPPPAAVGPQNLCYVIYTSGSTGRPKGTEIEHASLLRLMRWHFETYGFAPGDRATFFSGPSFDVAVWEVWSCLAAGASLHIPEGECRVSAPRMIRWLADERITHGVVSTPLAELMIGEPWPAALPLRSLTTGGDRLHQWPGADFPCPIYNIYGPTEGTIVTSCFVLRPGAGQEILPPIGRPLANVRVQILDPDFRPVRPGVAGELWIGGGGVARGYLERPELTAEKFVPDPFADERREPGARMYRSGDLARYLPDGNLEFLGRVDFQVKIRGFRIEPGEVEGELLALPGVRAAAVLPRDGGAVGTRLVAYLAGTPAPDDHLRDLLSGSLPDYMVPAAFVWLDALPLTPNGKVDRRELAAIPVEFAATTPYVAARTPVEAGLAALWAELLGAPAIGVQDDFFLLGGHSLLAVQVLSRIRDLFAVELALADVFDFPTVEELALAVERSRALQAASPAAPALVARPRHGEIPLSFAQQRLWFLERLRPGTPVYNMPMAYRLVGALRPAALAAALAEIVRRHEALRTRFTEGENGPVQSIASPPAASLPQVDLGGLPPTLQAAEEERLLAAEALRPFDLERGPLLRTLLLRRAAGEWVLMLSMHHIVADGWSLGVLLRELDALYGAAVSGEPSPLPELAVQYADFALWQREWLQGEALEGELAYWRQRLAGRPSVLELPTDWPRPTMPGFRGATEPLQLELELAERLRALGWETGTPLSMTLLAGFLALLGRYTGQ